MKAKKPKVLLCRNRELRFFSCGACYLFLYLTELAKLINRQQNMKCINPYTCSSLTQYQLKTLDHIAYLCASPPSQNLHFFFPSLNRTPNTFHYHIKYTKTIKDNPISYSHSLPGRSCQTKSSTARETQKGFPTARIC